MTVRRSNLLERLRNPARAVGEQETVLLTGSVCADMKEAADEIERLRVALMEAGAYVAVCPPPPEATGELRISLLESRALIAEASRACETI